jgi:hypothetical protein
MCWRPATQGFHTCHTSLDMSHPHVTCHMSHVTCHVSHVTCHMSHVTCHMHVVVVRSSQAGGRRRIFSPPPACTATPLPFPCFSQCFTRVMLRRSTHWQASYRQRLVQVKLKCCCHHIVQGLALLSRLKSALAKRCTLLRYRSCIDMSGSEYTIKHWQQRAHLAERRLEEMQQQQQPMSRQPAASRVSEMGLDTPTIPLQLLTAINSTLGLSVQVCARVPRVPLPINVTFACRNTTCQVPQPQFPPFMISSWSLSGNPKFCNHRWLVRSRVLPPPAPHCNPPSRPSPRPRSCRSRAGKQPHARANLLLPYHPF